MQTLREEQGLPLSSLRLFVPPLRLVCAALWQVIERRDIMDYGLLEEFATTVLEIVPELMSYRERVQLLMGLRARLVLELCRCDDELCRPDTVQPHLNRMRSCISNHKGEVSDPNVEASEANFTKLIETLMEEPKERELFFQNVFPEEFGPKYDSTLQILVWEFLSRLEKLLPAPNIKQTASWLNLAPALLEECVQSVAHPEPLQALLHHHKNGKQLDTNALRSTGGDYILSSLSSPSSVKEESASYQTDPERQSYPTMQGYQSPFPCDEPEMSWDCRMADCRVWTVKPPAGSASVEVEVETIEDATDIMVKRKTIDKESIKETRREAVLCPQTRSGLKTSRLTAACLRRQPVLRLNRLDISNMPLPKSLLTLILRRGRLQAEATRRPGPKRRGRKKKRRRGRGVANEKIETDTLDESDMPLPKSSLTLTLKRGIVQAEATSSQVPKKRGRKKGQKIGPGITSLKIEKVGVHTLDISDMSLPKTSLKLIIRRGKLQAEATDRKEGQKRRGRKKKWRRGRGVRNEKTEAKGVKRERSPETEEDAEPSDNELWTTVNKGPTVDESGGVHASPHCPSSHKREEELQHPVQNFHSEEHSGHMAKGQNREERSESVPQDSQTPEPSNSSHKRSFRSEEHRGHMAKGQNRKERSESVPQDSQTPEPSNTSHKRSFHSEEHSGLMAKGQNREERSESVPQDSQTPEPSNTSHKRSQRVKACSFCGKTFTDTLGLTRHMRSHIDQMSHQCTQCGQDFEFSEDLEDHQKHGCEEMNKKDNSEENGDDYCGRTVQQKPDLKKNPDLKRDKKPDLKGDKKPDLKGDKKPDLKGDKKPDLKGDKKPDLKGDKKPDLKGDKKPDLKGDKKPDLEGDKKPDLEGDKKPDLEGDKKPDLKGDKKPDLEGDKKPDPEGDKKPDLEGDKQPDLEGDKQPDLKGDKKPDLKGDTQDCSIKCHVCGKITTRMLGLRRHLLIHFNNGAYKCSACPKTFISNADLRSHLRSKRSCREKCSDEVITTGLHLKSVPGEYKCPYCGDTFQLPDDLRGHTKDCSRKCHVCGKTTARMLDMRRHMLKHNNNGPYKCPVCPRTFISHTDLKMHLKTKKLCREKCSDVMMNELLSSADGKCRENVTETGVMTRCQQPSSNNTARPLKSIEEFFEEFSHDLQQSDNSVSSEVNLNSLNSLDEDYSDEISQYQPMKDVDLNSLHEDSIMTTEDYSDEISQYQPIKDVDLNTLHEDYSQAEISQYQPVKDVDPEEDRRSVDDSGGNEMANDKEPNSTECLTEEQVSHTEACPLQDSQSETSGEVKNEIQRGKLQAEATGSQGQKRRGRKRKQKRGRGVRNEKTEAKGVKREHSPETEEDAEPSDKELWTSVNERTTVNDSVCSSPIFTKQSKQACCPRDSRLHTDTVESMLLLIVHHLIKRRRNCNSPYRTFTQRSTVVLWPKGRTEKNAQRVYLRTLKLLSHPTPLTKEANASKHALSVARLSLKHLA
ncbi:uncharacterized protein LOC115169455 isoform X1 [Salmo trutta]|uniref:uncharacterized protein LOC115169455 isoform X1 n=1 Tax=Salmo trutta TaxID=8032 RepID=UPI00113201FC|nr:uncharacterized protein LOC115169455 isoform X1 [Salmo trutta]